jgi:hypothetical protein
MIFSANRHWQTADALLVQDYRLTGGLLERLALQFLVVIMIFSANRHWQTADALLVQDYRDRRWDHYLESP